MKSFAKKTKAEIEAETTESRIKVKDYKDAYGYIINEWCSCDDCKVIFEPEDEVILKVKESGREICCPITKKLSGWISGEKVCGNHLYGGSADYYQKNYKVSDLKS